MKWKRRQHGLKQTRYYNIWRAMKARCYTKTNKNYHQYGGRGILVSPEFRYNFLSFYNYLKTIENHSEWLKDRTYSLDRIDNERGYETGNLRFATKSTQAANTRMYKNNTSGYRGVSFINRDGKYVAHVKENKKMKSLGHYHTAEAANTARELYLSKYTITKK